MIIIEVTGSEWILDTEPHSYTVLLGALFNKTIALLNYQTLQLNNSLVYPFLFSVFLIFVYLSVCLLSYKLNCGILYKCKWKRTLQKQSNLMLYVTIIPVYNFVSVLTQKTVLQPDRLLNLVGSHVISMKAIWRLYDGLWLPYGDFMTVMWWPYDVYMTALWRLYDGCMTAVWQLYNGSMMFLCTIYHFGYF